MKYELMFLAPLLSLVVILVILFFLVLGFIVWKFLTSLENPLTKIFTKCANSNQYSKMNSTECCYCKKTFLE